MLVGSIYMFAGSVAPAGFMLCDGSSISRSTYSELFGLIGTTYGTGDGSTTFNLPDLSGRVALGCSTVHTIGESDGEETHSLTDSELPAHTHEVPVHGHTSSFTVKTPSLSHTVTQASFTYAGPGASKAAKSTSSSGTRANNSTVNASRSANAAMANHAPATCTVSGGAEDAPAFDTTTAGGGASHSNMQPYVTMNYIIYVGEV